MKEPSFDVDKLTDEQIRQLYPKILERYKSITEKHSILETNELEMEVEQLKSLRSSLQNDIADLQNKIHDLEQELLTTVHVSKELEQQKIILNTVSTSLENKTQELEKFSNNLEQKLQQKDHDYSESEQAKMFLTELSEHETTKRKHMQKKYYVAFVLCVGILVATIATFALYEKMRDDQRERILSSALKGKFTIKNLKGEAISTWATWNLVENETLYVSIINQEKFPQNKIDVVKEAILSTETDEIDNSLLNKEQSGSSTYYKGWKGALENIGQSSTEFYIPKKIEVSETDSDGDIIIQLTNDLDMDGNSGYTNSIVDQNQILHATITVYLVGDLTNERLATVVRHEFGHALGLPHSTDTEDLMAPVTATKYPYISECDMNAIVSLYNNKQSTGDFVCEKEVK